MQNNRVFSFVAHSPRDTHIVEIFETGSHANVSEVLHHIVREYFEKIYTPKSITPEELYRVYYENYGGISKTENKSANPETTTKETPESRTGINEEIENTEKATRKQKEAAHP